MGLVTLLTNTLGARQTGLLSWALAIALFVASVVATLVLSPWLDTFPFITFFPTTLAVSLLCGWRQGASVMVLSALAAWCFFTEPPFSFAFADFSAVLSIARFLIVGTFFVALIEVFVQAVQQLSKTARLNEDLFHELQHRVANNLQIVAATLEKAQRGIQDSIALEAIDHVRVHSMARLHRRLYDAAAYAEGLEPILRDLLAETFRALPVNIKFDIRYKELSVAEMTAIALLVNEAAINSAKHVFRPRKGTKFGVALVEAESVLRLTIQDDCQGIPAQAAAGPQPQRFGFAVMRGLAAQLGGSLEIPEGPGTTLQVEFWHAP
jgi:hypothetical protein